MAGPPRKRQRREEARLRYNSRPSTSDNAGGDDDDPALDPGAGQAVAMMPQKKFYRQRAHANPFSDHDLEYPHSPEAMDWSYLFPAFFPPKTSNASDLPDRPALSDARVEVADIGCGFGGLLFALAPQMPHTLILGMEIRTSVTEFVQEKIKAMRVGLTGRNNAPTAVVPPPPSSEPQREPESAPAAAAAAAAPATDAVDGAASETTQPRRRPSYQNIACLRANAMKFLPNFFRRAQLSKIFLCFPDPHFKARKRKARIVSAALAAEYAYVLRPGGRVYTITDVEELHGWMTARFEECESFVAVEEGEVDADGCVAIMRRETEEGKKVERNGGRKFVSVWMRTEDPPWPE